MRRLLLPALLALAPSVFGPGALAAVAAADPGVFATRLADAFGQMGLYTLADLTRRCSTTEDFDPDAPAFAPEFVDLRCLDQLLAQRRVRQVHFVEALAVSLDVEGLTPLADRVGAELVPLVIGGVRWTLNQNDRVVLYADDPGTKWRDLFSATKWWRDMAARTSSAEGIASRIAAEDDGPADTEAVAEPTDSEPADRPAGPTSTPSAAQAMDQTLADIFASVVRPADLGPLVLELVDCKAPGIARLAEYLVELADPGRRDPTRGRSPVDEWHRQWASAIEVPLESCLTASLNPDVIDTALALARPLCCGEALAGLAQNEGAPGLQQLAHAILALPVALKAVGGRA